MVRGASGVFPARARVSSPPDTAGSLAKEIRAGNIRAVARGISLFESSASSALARRLLAKIFPYTGGAYLIGITGPSGVGKSTLVDRLVAHALERKPQQKVACLLIDPTNQVTGGSILGDRIRFGAERALDERVFIRSLAAGTRLGGLTHHIREAVAVLEAGGYGLIIIETVGVGQSEIEIVKVAHSVVVACQPASGDSIQMLKAGVQQIGHVVAINKADLGDLADELYRTVATSSSPHSDGWKPIVLKTSAQKGRETTVRDLYEAIIRHRAFLESGGLLEKRKRESFEAWVRDLVDRRVVELARRRFPIERETRKTFAGLSAITTSPYEVARQIAKRAGVR